MKVLYIGGTGQISLDCVHASVRAGHAVWVFNRGNANSQLPDTVRVITGDLNDDAAYARIADGRFDAVCQFQVYDVAALERDLALLTSKTRQYVFISSASAYQKPVTAMRITEDVPLDNPYWSYSRNKAACEARLREQTALPWTIVRPSHTSRSSLTTAMGEGDLAASRMLRGKPVVVPGDGTSLWTVTASADFAPPFVKLLGHPRALGEAFHLTSDQAWSWRAIYRAMGRALGAEPQLVGVPSDTLVRYRPDWEGPLWGDKSWTTLFDNTKIKSVVGDFTCDTPLDTFMAQRVQAFLDRGGADEPIDTQLDALFDQIIAPPEVPPEVPPEIAPGS